MQRLKTLEDYLRSQLEFQAGSRTSKPAESAWGSAFPGDLFCRLVQRTAATEPTRYQSIVGGDSSKQDPKVFVCRAMQSVKELAISTVPTTTYGGCLN